MREPSYNHKIKVLLPEPNSETQQLADCLFFFIISLSPNPGVINLLCISYFENETENIKPESVFHFLLCEIFEGFACMGFGYAGLWHRGSNTISF